MTDYNYLYETYFKEFEDIQEDKEFFKKEVNSILEDVYTEIEFTKEHIRISSKGIEVAYHSDMNKFKKDLEKWKKVFIGDDVAIKEPLRISKIFAMNYNYLTHLGIKKETINQVFEVIREDLFELIKPPSHKRAQNELMDFLKIACIRLEELKSFQKDNPTLNRKQLTEKFEEKIKNNPKK